MSRPELAGQVARTLGTLLLRGNRGHLYAHLTEDVPGVDATLYPVLSGLARIGPSTATQLARVIGLDRTVTTRHASKLEAEGLLARLDHPDDARATVLTLTELGHQTIDQLRAGLDDVVLGAMSDWSESEVRTFTRLFGQLTEALGRGREGPGDRGGPLPDAKPAGAATPRRPERRSGRATARAESA
jgi:DNA-binding MarR family transcriptional regulator